MIIETKPFEDEYGNRSWRDDRCRLGRACIQGYRENPIPDICRCYQEPTPEMRAEQCMLEEKKEVRAVRKAPEPIEPTERKPERARIPFHLVGLP